MKKFLAIAFSVLLLGLSACSREGDNAHDHDFSGGWTTTSGSHYKVCTVDGCNEQSEKANHEFENGKCKVCAYNQPTISTKE